MIQFDFESRKLRVTSRIIFEADVDVEVLVDTYKDGTLVESLRKVAMDKAVDEAHRIVSQGLSQVRVVNISASLIPEKGKRNSNETLKA